MTLKRKSKEEIRSSHMWAIAQFSLLKMRESAFYMLMILAAISGRRKREGISWLHNTFSEL